MSTLTDKNLVNKYPAWLYSDFKDCWAEAGRLCSQLSLFFETEMVQQRPGLSVFCQARSW